MFFVVITSRSQGTLGIYNPFLSLNKKIRCFLVHLIFCCNILISYPLLYVSSKGELFFPSIEQNQGLL